MGVVAASEELENPFSRILADKKVELGVDLDSDLDAEALKSLVAAYKIEVLRATETSFPDDPVAQLWGAIRAVFHSWNTTRAATYRRAHGIDDAAGTAVNVQAMVFGNMGPDSATGVAFTRNPATGAPGLFGEFLANAQGEDVVAGVRTPDTLANLEKSFPKAHAELTSIADRLERHFGDMQDLEFTIQKGTLWLLQTRNGKRSGRAMIRVAVDMVKQELIDERTAINRIDPSRLDEVLHPTIDPECKPPVIAKGLPASPGAAIGALSFTATDAEKRAARGEAVILVRAETSPEDIHGLMAASGILTARGGMTSHAAVVARGMGKPCVAGCSTVAIDAIKRELRAGDQVFSVGDVITIDGSTGEVFSESASLVPATMDDDFDQLMAWVDGARRLRVRTNADTAVDARTARAFGAEGIGLCRTEHMFFAPERIRAVREMILADTEAGRHEALTKILPMQRDDFVEIFQVMDGLPVTIRLLDPPLHEFLPHGPEDVAALAVDLGRPVEEFARVVESLRESNPMLGHRGCRLAITHPEIYQIQTRALAEAALQVAAEGVEVKPEIMIPFVCVPGELGTLRSLVSAEYERCMKEADADIACLIGTMIELPRACLVGDAIAEHADFFSFGTNDLTQTTFGLSRDDGDRFLPQYMDSGLMARSPFEALDRSGVGALVRIGVEKGRAVKTKLKIGICGEHGGDPSSVEFFHIEGFDYVSCSPFRVPIARVAAAKAALRREARAK